MINHVSTQLLYLACIIDEQSYHLISAVDCNAHLEIVWYVARRSDSLLQGLWFVI